MGKGGGRTSKTVCPRKKGEIFCSPKRDGGGKDNSSDFGSKGETFFGKKGALDN